MSLPEGHEAESVSPTSDLAVMGLSFVLFAGSAGKVLTCTNGSGTTTRAGPRISHRLQYGVERTVVSSTFANHVKFLTSWFGHRIRAVVV
jgi:hypothetical protein